MENQRHVLVTADGAVTDVAGDAVAVLDTKANLMWSLLETKQMKFKAAQKHCSDLKLAGFSDWRLPTIQELFALADHSRVNPAIDTSIFPNCELDWYWSGTVHATAPADCAWIVHFLNGYASYDNQNYTGFVRAVRSGQSSDFGGESQVRA